MKIYKKTYESVFDKNRTLKKDFVSNITIDNDISLQKYITMVSDTMLEMQKSLFDYIIRISWLFRQFRYNSAKRKFLSKNGYQADAAFGNFMRKIVGVESRLFTMNNLFPKIASYLDDFFPNFDELDPFEKKLEYPFKNIGFEFLCVVYRMKERMEILQYCDDVNMKYSEFLDYMINYVYNYNEELGYDYYIFRVTKNHFQPYITVNKLYEHRV